MWYDKFINEINENFIMNKNLNSLIKHVTYISGDEFISNKEPYVDYYSNYHIYDMNDSRNTVIFNPIASDDIRKEISPKYIDDISIRMLQKHNLLINNIKSLVDHYCSYYNTSHSGIAVSSLGIISRIVGIASNGDIILLPVFSINNLVNMVDSDYLELCKLP